MTINGVKTIGLIGAGHIGSQVARAAIASGYDVVISNSRGPETLTELVSELGPRARAGTTQEAAAAGDLVVVAIPLKAIGDVPAEPLVGKVGDRYQQLLPHGGMETSQPSTTAAATSSELLQARLRGRTRGEGVQSHLCPPDHQRRQRHRVRGTGELWRSPATTSSQRRK